MLLMDKVCVIAGAASLRSIGYATAELFAEHGAKVVVVDVMMDDKILGELKSSIEKKSKCQFQLTACNAMSASQAIVTSWYAESWPCTGQLIA